MNMLSGILRAKTRKPPDEESSIPLVENDHRNNLVRTMACLEDHTSTAGLKEFSNPYFRFLESTLRQIPDNLLEIVQSPNLADATARGAEKRLHGILKALAESLKNEPNHVYLRRLCTQLESRGFVSAAQKHPASLASASAVGGTEEWVPTAQLVFSLLGILTMLYEPNLSPSEGRLEILSVNLEPKLHCHSLSMATWTVMSQDISGLGQDVSLDDLLCQYSGSAYGPVPRPKMLQQPGQQSHTPESDILRSQDVSFYTLAKLLSVNINQEIEAVPVPIILRNAVFDGTGENVSGQLLESNDIKSADYFREVIATYRLIFGQHEDARDLIKQFCAQGRLLNFKIPFKNPHPSAFVKHNADPLLEELCFKDSRNVPLFAELDLLGLKNIYALDTDFPHFANRLSILKDFVEHQCPQDWKVLWRDRRDVAKFWTIWAVVLFGVPTLILSVIQTILTGLQLRPN